MAESTGNGKTIGISATIAGSLIFAAGTVVWKHIDAVATSASIALQVARDHGTELETIRQRHEAVTMQMADLRAQLSLGRRFTSEDGEKLQRMIDRLSGRVDRIDDRIRFGIVSGNGPQE